MGRGSPARVALSQTNIGSSGKMDLTGIWWKCLPLHSPVLAYCTSSSSQLDKTFVGGKHRISHTDKQKISQTGKYRISRMDKRNWERGELVVVVGGGVVGGGGVVVVVGGVGGEGGGGGEQIDDSLYKSRDLPQAPLLSS